MKEKLAKKIAYAKTCCLPQRQLHYVYGLIVMAHELKAITTEEYLELNHKCVAKGINNPKYFDSNCT